MEDFVSRQEYETGKVYLDNVHANFDSRIDKLENLYAQISELASSVKLLASNIENMQKEQEKQGKRLVDIEKKPADNWDKLIWGIVGCAVTLILGYIAKGIGL